ncbi:MAG: fibronectin type III domain-containing protein [Planctomycetes bacterium]|nr:fibronectin type III domain-containing protein [Planctomycetota bacterium]
MNRKIAVRFLAAPAICAGLLAVLAPGLAPQWGGSATLPFDELSLFVESNVVDNDADVILRLDSGVGLKSLKVVGPDGKKVMGLATSGNPIVGHRRVEMESTEPASTAVLAAFPEGRYRFHGVSVGGERLFGEATLSHALLAAPTVTSPASGATDVPLTGVTASWTPTPGVTRYIVEVEEEDVETSSLVVSVPGTSTSFAIPDGWLLPGTTYQIGVGAVGPNGNVTVYEHLFTTTIQ